MKLTAIIEREGPGYVSLFPELDIASQGDTIEQARARALPVNAGGEQDKGRELARAALQVLGALDDVGEPEDGGELAAEQIHLVLRQHEVSESGDAKHLITGQLRGHYRRMLA